MPSIDINRNGDTIVVTFAPTRKLLNNMENSAPSSKVTCPRGRRHLAAQPVVKKLLSWELLVAQDSNERRYLKASQGTGNPFSSASFVAATDPVPFRYKGRYTATGPFLIVENWISRSLSLGQLRTRRGTNDHCNASSARKQREKVVVVSSGPMKKRGGRIDRCSGVDRKPKKDLAIRAAERRETIAKLRAAALERRAIALGGPAHMILASGPSGSREHLQRGCLPTVLIMFDDEEAPFLTLRDCIHPLDSIAQLRERIITELDKASGGDILSKEMAWSFSGSNPPLLGWLEELYNDFLTFYTDNEHMRLSGQAAKEVRFATKQHRYLADVLKPLVHNVRRLTERMTSVFQLCQQLPIPVALLRKYGTPQNKFFGQTEIFFGPAKVPLITGFGEVRDAVNPVKHAVCAQLERMIGGGAPPVDCGLEPYKVTFRRAALQVITDIRRARAKSAFQPRQEGVAYLPVIRLRKHPKLFTNVAKNSELKEIQIRDCVTRHATPSTESFAVPFVPSKNLPLVAGGSSAASSPRSRSPGSRRTSRSYSFVDQQAAVDDVTGIELATEEQPCPSLRWADGLGLSLSHYALLRHDIRMLQALCVRQADISVPDASGCTVLHRLLLLRSCRPGFRIQALTELLNGCNADRMLQNALRARLHFDGDTVLGLAARLGQFDAVQVIFEAIRERLLPVASALLTTCVLPEETSALATFMPITQFISTGDISGVRFWLDCMQLNVNSYRCGTADMPLLSAALSAQCLQERKDEVIVLLLTRGAWPMEADSSGRSSLHYAVASQQMKWLFPLVDEVARKSSMGTSGSSKSVSENRQKPLLFTHAADNAGNTFLHVMLEQCRSHADLEQFGLPVLQHPAVLSSMELERRNHAGNSILHLVMLCRNAVIAKQLTKTLVYESHHTIETLFCARNENGDTPLGNAVRSGFAAGLHMTLSLDIVAEVALRTRNSFDRSLILLAVDVEGAKTFIGDKTPAMANRPHCEARTQNNVLHALLTYASTQPNPKEIIDEISGDRGESALHSAVRNALWHTAALLLTFQASPMVLSSVAKRTPLELSFANRSDPSMARLLLANDRSGIASVATLRSCIAARGAASFSTDLLHQHFFARDSLLADISVGESSELLRECVAAGNLNVVQLLCAMGIAEASTEEIFESLLRTALADERLRSRDASLPRKRCADLGPCAPQFATFDLESLLIQVLLLYPTLVPACAMYCAVSLRFERLAELMTRVPVEVQLKLVTFVDATSGSTPLHALCGCAGQAWWEITVHVVYFVTSMCKESGSEVLSVRDKCQRTPLHVAHDEARVDLMLLLLSRNSFVGSSNWMKRFADRPRSASSKQQRELAHWILLHSSLPFCEFLEAAAYSSCAVAALDVGLTLPSWAQPLSQPVRSSLGGVLGALAAVGDCSRLKHIVNKLATPGLDLQEPLDAILYRAAETALETWPCSVVDVVELLISSIQQVHARPGVRRFPSLLNALFCSAESSRCQLLCGQKTLCKVERLLGHILPFVLNSPLSVTECSDILAALLRLRFRNDGELAALDRCLTMLLESSAPTCAGVDCMLIFSAALTTEHLAKALRINAVRSLTKIARSFADESIPFPQLACLTQLPLPHSGKWFVNALAATSVPSEEICCVLDKSREEVHAIKQRCSWWVEELLDIKGSKFQQVPLGTQREFPVLCFMRSLAKTDPGTTCDFAAKAAAMSPLHASIYYRRPDLASHILHVSPFAVLLDLDLDVEDSLQRTPLILAAKLGDVALFRDLLGLGANIMAEEATGLSCLHFAAKHGFDEMIQVVKEHEDGSHVLRSNTAAGSNALLQAVKSGQDRSATLLLSYPVYTDTLLTSISLRGENLIHFCALRGCAQTLQILLRRCPPAYVGALTPSGLSARDYCKPRTPIDDMLASAGLVRLARLTLCKSLSSEDIEANPNILSLFDHRREAAAMLLRIHDRVEPMTIDERAWMLACRGMDDELLELLKLGATDLVRVRFINLPRLASEAAKQDFAKDLQTLLGNRFGGAQRVEVVSDSPTPYAIAFLRDETRVPSVLASDSIAVHGQILQATRDPPLGPTYRSKVLLNTSSILHEACKSGCVKAVNFSIASNSPGGIPSRLICDLFTKHFDKMGLSPYHYAILEKKWSIALELIRWRIPVHPARDFPRSPLEMFPSLPHLTEVRASVAMGLPGNPSIFAFGDDSKFALHSRITELDADVLGYVRVRNSSNIAAATRVQRSLLTCDLDKIIGGQVVSALGCISDIFDFEGTSSRAAGMAALLRAHLRGETMRWIIDVQSADDRDNALERERCKGLLRYHLAGGVLLRSLSTLVETLLTKYGSYGCMCFLTLKTWNISCAKNLSSVTCRLDPSDGEVSIAVFVQSDDTLVFPDMLKALDEYFLLQGVLDTAHAIRRYASEDSWLRIVTPDPQIILFLDLLRAIEQCHDHSASVEVLRRLEHLHVKLRVNGTTSQQLLRKLEAVIETIENIREACLDRRRFESSPAGSSSPREVVLPGCHHHALTERCSVIVCVVPDDGVRDALQDVLLIPSFHGLELLNTAGSDTSRGKTLKKRRGVELLLKARISTLYETAVALTVTLNAEQDASAVQLVCGSNWPAAAMRQFTWNETGINAHQLQRAMKPLIRVKQPQKAVRESGKAVQIEDVSFSLQTPTKQQKVPPPKPIRFSPTVLSSASMDPIISQLKESLLDLVPLPAAQQSSPGSKRITRELRNRKQHDEMDTFLLTVFEFSMDIRFALCVMRRVSRRWNDAILRLFHFDRSILSLEAGEEVDTAKRPLSIFEAMQLWSSRMDCVNRRLAQVRESGRLVRCGEVHAVLDLLRGQQLLGSKLAAFACSPKTAAQQMWTTFLRDPLMMFAYVATSVGFREASFREGASTFVKKNEKQLSPDLASVSDVSCASVIDEYFREAYAVIGWSARAGKLLQHAECWQQMQSTKAAATPSPLRLGS